MTSSMSNTGYSTSWFDNTPGTLARIDDDVRKYGDMIKGAELRIRELRGESPGEVPGGQREEDQDAG